MDRSEEIFVAGSRAAAVTSARGIELMAPHPGAWAPPLRRTLRAALRIEDVILDGVPATRYSPQGNPSGTILYFHGGGFVSGSPALEVSACCTISPRSLRPVLHAPTIVSSRR